MRRPVRSGQNRAPVIMLMPGHQWVSPSALDAARKLELMNDALERQHDEGGLGTRLEDGRRPASGHIARQWHGTASSR